MTQRKPPQPPKKAEISIVRSSAAEHLTFIAASRQGVSITQKMMAQRYDVDVRTINYHLKKVFSDSELEADCSGLIIRHRFLG